jgi:hypothetical protein
MHEALHTTSILPASYSDTLILQFYSAFLLTYNYIQRQSYNTQQLFVTPYIHKNVLTNKAIKQENSNCLHWYFSIYIACIYILVLLLVYRKDVCCLFDFKVDFLLLLLSNYSENHFQRHTLHYVHYILLRSILLLNQCSYFFCHSYTNFSFLHTLQKYRIHTYILHTSHTCNVGTHSFAHIQPFALNELEGMWLVSVTLTPCRVDIHSS